MVNIGSDPKRPAAKALSMAALAMLALAIGLPGVIGAQAGSVPAALAGTWSYDGTAAQGMAIVEAAFAPGIRSLPELFQGMARDRVRENMRPPARVVVTLTGANVRVVMESDHTTVITGPLGGRASTSGVSDSTTVASRLRAGWLEFHYDGEGDMDQLFSTEPDGSRMHVDYTVTSDRLPEPVRYRLDYVRAP